MPPFTPINPPRTTEVPVDRNEPHFSKKIAELDDKDFAAVCWHFGKPEDTSREKRERMMRMFKRIVACHAELVIRKLKSDKVVELAGVQVPPSTARETVTKKLRDRMLTAIRSYFTECKKIWEEDKNTKDVNVKVDLGNEYYVVRDPKHHEAFLEQFEHFKNSKYNDIPDQFFPTTPN